MFERNDDLAATRKQKSSLLDRLEKAGELEANLVHERPVGHRAIFYLFGYAAVIVGVLMLIGGLVNSPYITG